MNEAILKTLIQQNDKKIVLIVADGLSGCDHHEHGTTALSYAQTPNLDGLAAKSEVGLFDPIAPGITPGSGPGHLSLFGYDPVKYNIGRGVLGALGIDFDLKEGDLAIRVNFCTLSKDGIILDRRAGRISSDENKMLCDLIKEKIKITEKTEFYLLTEKDHRACMILRGDDFDEGILETDPQVIGVPPLEPLPQHEKAKKTSIYLAAILKEIKEILITRDNANMVLLRGYAKYKRFETIQARFGLNAISITEYPMYRGLAKLVGMGVSEPYNNLSDVSTILEKNYSSHDFFFIHFKKTDAAGEDGNFTKKVKEIEFFDEFIPDVLRFKPDVLVITGDHSTPSIMSAHSWHPVPFLLHSPFVRASSIRRFDEKSCERGLWSRIKGKDLMVLMLANAGKLKKFGA